MAKLINPLHSLGAVGQFTKDFVIRNRGKTPILEAKPFPTDAQTSAQLAWRTMYQLAVSLWHSLTAAEQATWETLARPRHMTGYAYFLSQALRPNPGIYLPLAGGHMTGNVAADPGVTFDGVDLSEIPLGSYLPLAGGTMSGNIAMASNRITNLPAPVADEEPTRKIDQTWTLNKLRKGAGAGVAPTEIAIGTGANDVAAGDHTHTLADDTSGVGVPGSPGIGSSGTFYNKAVTILTGADSTAISKTLTFATASRAVAVAAAHGCASVLNTQKLRLYMAGIQVAESAYLSTSDNLIVLVAITALTGSQSIAAAIHNYSPGSTTFYICAYSQFVKAQAWAVGAGSIKI